MTYEDIAKEIINSLPKFKIGMKFETINSIYPENNIPRNIKNINEKVTKPLALSSKDKRKIRKKENNVIKDFLSFKKSSKEKGDILIVKELKENFAICENISRPKEIDDKYFDNEDLKYVKVSFKDILEGNIKEIKRLRSI